MSQHKVFLGLGSNVGDRSGNLCSAVSALESHPDIELKSQSTVIETKPMGNINQEDFLNQVVQINTILSPHKLLHYCLSIEESLGRTRDQKWGPRTLDIDILFYDALVLWEQNLMIPHPEVHKRLFMLEPLLELAPEHIHPVFQQSIQAIHSAF